MTKASETPTYPPYDLAADKRFDHTHFIENRNDLTRAAQGFVTDIRAFPEGAGLRLRAAYHLSAFSPDLFAKLEIDRPQSLSRAVDKRLAEFLAGRVLAQLGQRMLGLDPVPIPIDVDRSPVWPAGVAGSISHAKGACASLLLPQDRGLPGIDIEGIASGKALAAILSVAMSAQDMRVLEQAADLATAATLCFSAKETLFKSLYPVVGRFFGFDCAQLVPLPDHTGLTLELMQDLSKGFEKGRRFHVCHEVSNAHVLTWRF